ncbi:MAG TPA: serine/threonine-protein kinase [Planctomycetaceae bacterium]|jgi:serine/threonine-protein kinase
MSLNSDACDHDLLRLSLDDRLSEQQEDALARHLTECTNCQCELARLAGSDADWSKVSLALKYEAESACGAGNATRATTPRTERDEDDADDSSADFAVDFLEPSSAPQTLGRLADIDILEVIGRGGMGVVLKGYQAELKRLVAVKVLAPHLAVSAAARKRFAREAQAAAAILHPNVMPILTVHSGGKLPYLVMPFLACESLEQRIARDGPLPLVDLLRIGMQSAQGLAAAHAQGIVHRDVKPANILLDLGVDRVMLTDFGLARAIDDASITRTGLIAGTPQYMSPEQARGEPLDARSDLFSLGSVLYAMAAGRPPFRAETSYGILRRITDSDPRPVREINEEIPTWLAAIIDKMLAKAPADRLESAQRVAAILEQCLAHVQQPTLAPLPDFCRARRPPRWLTVPLVICCATVALVAAFLLWPGSIDRPAAPASDSAASDPSPAGSVPTADNSTPRMPVGSATEWDAVADQLDQLDRDGRVFETRNQREWDRLPIPLPPETNSDSDLISRPHLENDP